MSNYSSIKGVDIRSRIKAAAVMLRQALSEKGEEISHSQALHRLSKMMGFKNWHVLSALANTEPERISELSRSLGGA